MLTLTPAKEKAVLAFSLLALAFGIVAYSWVCDDAYITFRVVDNFINGYGLRYNVDERVQAYTNPLWLFLHVPFYMAFGNIFLITVFLSWACIAGAIGMLARIRPFNGIVFAGVIVLPLTLSPTFLDFATSGLETPLTLLLFAMFTRCLCNRPQAFFTLTLIASLSALNRFDTLFFYAPALAWHFFHAPRPVRWKNILYGFSPVAGWLGFSLFYYGFLFPNTKYAKLNTGISCWVYLQQGFGYLADFLIRDSISACMMIAAGAGGLYCLWKCRRNTECSATYAHNAFPLLPGIIAYVLYVIYVGGDFMSGRLFMLPFMAASFVIYCFISAPAGLRLGMFLFTLVAVKAVSQTVIFIWNLLYVSYPPQPHMDYPPFGIGVERQFYFPDLSFIDYANRTVRTNADQHLWVKTIREDRAKCARFPCVIVRGEDGLNGFYGGPDIYLIDFRALPDALLARMPLSTDRWRIGHMDRITPQGYLHARETGDVSQMNPNIAMYYDKLRLITSGPLFSGERLYTIAAFNFGFYEHYRRDYLRDIHYGEVKP